MAAIAGLDRIDRQILRLLQQDAQITNLDLSARVHLSPAACLRRVENCAPRASSARRWRCWNRPRSRWPRWSSSEWCWTAPRPESFTDFEAAARGISGCLECHLVAGEFDYFLMLRIRDLERFNKLHAGEIIKLPGVRQIRTFSCSRRSCRPPNCRSDEAIAQHPARMPKNAAMRHFRWRNLLARRRRNCRGCADIPTPHEAIPHALLRHAIARRRP